MPKTRSEPPPRIEQRESVTFGFGVFEFDEERWELRRGGTAVSVPPKVMQTIGILVKNRDRIVPIEELFATLWPDVVVTDASLAKSIRIARQVLGDDGNSQQFIKTTRGRGYRFVAPVRESRARRSTRPPPPVDVSDGDSRSADAPLIGREQELKELRGALGRASGGRGSFFLVQGEVGSGKTRLVESFAEAAVERGARVAWGRCCEEGGAPELWPYRQITRSLPGEPWADEASSLGLTELGADEAPAGGFGALQTEAARFRFFDSLAERIRRAAEDRPVVLVLEDLHSSDGASLALTRFLARDLSSFGVVLVGTYRPSDVESRPELDESISKLIREAQTIAVAGLREEEIRGLLEATLDFAPDAAVVSKVQHVTEGNPLFVAEVARRIKTIDGGKLGEEIELPQRVIEVMRGRLDALPQATQDVLSTAAAIGRAFELPVLERVVGLQRDALVRQLEAAIDRRIVVSHGGASIGSYRFSHTLFRTVLYEATGVARRSELHLKIGEVLEALSPSGTEVPAAQLAHHFRIAAGGGASSRAAKYEMEAGHQALRSFAFEDAARHFDGALDCLRLGAGEEPLVIETLTSLGHAHRLAGNYSGASVAFGRALGIARERGDRSEENTSELQTRLQL